MARLSRNSATGVTAPVESTLSILTERDADRTSQLSELAELAIAGYNPPEDKSTFAKRFESPGHVQRILATREQVAHLFRTAPLRSAPVAQG